MSKKRKYETSLQTFILFILVFILLMFVWYEQQRARRVPLGEWASVCSIHMQIVHIKSFLLHLNDNNVHNNNNIRTHIIR